MPATPTATDLMAGIKEYAGLGWHRTGSLGDEATTEWLIRRLAQIGVRGVAHPFLFPQVEIARAEIQFGGATLAGHPQFDAGTTGPAGVTGPLVPPDRAAAGAIVVIDVTHDHVSIVDRKSVV